MLEDGDTEFLGIAPVICLTTGAIGELCMTSHGDRTLSV